MPFYVYKCEQCGGTYEAFHLTAGSYNDKCGCGGSGKLMPSTFGIGSSIKSSDNKELVGGDIDEIVIVFGIMKKYDV